MRDDGPAVDNSYRLDDEERSLYGGLGYFFIMFLVYSVARHFIPQPFGTSIGVFIPLFGTWFVHPAKRIRFPLLRWTGICLAASIVLGLFALWIERL